MSVVGLSLFAAVYLAGLLLLRKSRKGLIAYIWGAFGLAAILIFAGQIGGWNGPLGAAQVWVLEQFSNLVGGGLHTIGNGGALVVPDPTGWSILQVGIECSALIEISVFAGLLLFYPRIPSGERLGRLTAGVLATIAINLVRLGIIVVMVSFLGDPAVPWAHAVVGRIVFFIGILVVYWQMLTMPTLAVVRRGMETMHRNTL
jgi:exosortase family protein XrtG